MIPYGKQSISEEDISSVIEVLRSDWITQGPAIDSFEQGMSDYCAAQYAVATCNATAALHIACLALGLAEGDLLWTSPNTFVASANCARYCGADVDFVDIDPDTYNMSISALTEKLEQASSLGRLPKIVIPVHFAGQSCEMKQIAELAKQYGFSIIEDASHAVGADYLGQKVGSCLYSDMAVFSFHPVKILTTGEGGMVLTNNPEMEKTLKRLRSHGITRDSESMATESEGGWYYQQIELGFNYRITDIQAALGLSQLSRLDDFIARRRIIAARYDEILSGLPVTKPVQNPNGLSSYHLYPVRLCQGSVNKPRQEVFDALRSSGIGVNVHYIPVHLQPYYQNLGFGKGDFPVAEQYYSEAISLPLFYSLSDEDQDVVVASLKNALQ
jgi:UDP-4-amino-4,6-dideoxy-N-acetyl-beta-L-altrosamine transaminase